MENRSMDKDRNISIPIILSTVILVSLIGNLMVVVISTFCMRLRSLTAIFILNLALSDLLSTAALTYLFYSNFWGLIYGDVTCENTGFAQTAGFYSSVLFLVLLSVQRYTAVVNPVSGWKKGGCVAVLTWIVSLYAASLDLTRGIAQFDLNGHVYGYKDVLDIFIFRQTLVFVFAFLFMAFCYVRILRTVVKSQTNQNHRHRATGLSFFLVATFFICWAPYNIMYFMQALRLLYIRPFNTEPFHYAFHVCRLLAFSRCCFNPVIYGIFGLKFRETAREILQRGATLNSAETGSEEGHPERV